VKRGWNNRPNRLGRDGGGKGRGSVSTPRCHTFDERKQIRRPSSEIKFRVVELKTPRFSAAIGSNLYAEYFFVFLVAAISATVPASVAALST